MSFAVDKFGETFAWGENKHNALLINEKNRTFPHIDIPTKVVYPDFFIGSANVNIILNNQGGITMYEAKRPVKSIASETQ